MQIPIGFALFFEAFIGFKRMFVEGFYQIKYTFGAKKCIFCLFSAKAVIL